MDVVHPFMYQTFYDEHLDETKYMAISLHTKLYQMKVCFCY